MTRASGQVPSPKQPVSRRARLRRWAERAVWFLSVAYAVVLVAAWLAFRYVGEGFWVTGVGLLLPRLGFLLPWPVLGLLALGLRPGRGAWLALGVAALVGIVPLMGLSVGLPLGGGDGPRLRLLTYNVNSSYGGVDAVVQAIASHEPDVVVVQEIFDNGPALETKLRERFAHVHLSTQFLIASRFALRDIVDPPQIPYFGRQRSPRFMRYVVESNLGPIALYNVHPHSPRHALYTLRGQGLRKEILSGRLFRGEAAGDVQENAVLRDLRIAAAREMAQRESLPVLIAGDLNLPGQSATFQKYLASYQDGFEEAGIGFGYTFPTRFPWMRLDRILASDALKFTDFAVGCGRTSDHHCVIGELVRR